METYGTSGGTDAAGSVTDRMSDATAQAADQAKSTLKDAKDQAGEQIESARSEAANRVRDQLDQRSTQAGEQVSGLADVARKMSGELRDQGNDPHARVADQVADNMERLGGYLRNADADQMLTDVEDFGRRQPMALAAAGVLVGLLAARFVKASSTRRSAERSYAQGSQWGQSPSWQSTPPAVGSDLTTPRRSPGIATGPTGLELPTSTDASLSGRGY